MDKLFFYIFAAAAVGGALATVTRKNPLTCALSLVVTFVALSGLYFLLHAPFAGALQILVYAGAIMVLVLFVIMFLNLPEAQQEEERVSKPGLIVSLFLLVPLAALCIGVLGSGGQEKSLPPVAVDFGSVAAVGDLMFTKFVFQFEAVSILLLVAIVGAVMLAKKRL
jgi:NADH-quinone oxidoreductase subunit J